jgi:RNA polymerase sigma-70 factor (ECF subfamily)
MMPAMDELLRTALAAGRAAWPGLTVADDVFAAALQSALEEGVTLDDIAVADLYLAQACAAGAPGAVDAFTATYDSVISACLRGMDLPTDVIEELAQEIRIKLFAQPPRIATYSGRASLASWVRTIATRAAIDRLRSEQGTLPEQAFDGLPDQVASPELDHFRRTYRAEFKAAFEAALASLEVRERNVLRQHYVDGLSTEQIGALYDVHKTTTFRWIDAARDKLNKRTRNEFLQRVKVKPDELEAILRLVQSQLDLSLSRVL